MKTLNQIKYDLLGWFNGHAQINSVSYENDFDFNANRNLTYPVANIEFINSSINEKSLNHNFKVLLGDLTDKNYPDQVDDVLSDSIQIAEDFFSFLQDQEGWVFNRSVTLNPFIDDGGDRVSGVVFTITLSVIRLQDTCVTPTK